MTEKYRDSFFLFSVFLYFCWQSFCPTYDLCLGETLSIVTPMTLYLPSLSANLWHSNIPLSMNVRC